MDKNDQIQAWSAYWRTGALASCFHGRDLDAQFARIWSEFVDLLVDGDSLLDMATGNGAAARACAVRAQQRGIRLRIEGVDAAEIMPPANTIGIVFRGGVCLENLPYADGTFEAACSQFGLEYADEEKAATETTRVLAMGGRLRLVMHASGGAVFADVSARVRRLRAALAEYGPINLALSLARAQARADDAALRRLEERVPAAIETMRLWANAAPHDDAALFYGTAMLNDWMRRQSYRPVELVRAFEAGMANASAVAARQEWLLRAARSESEMAALAQRFTALGLSVAPPEQIGDARGGVIAWLLDAQKAS